MDELQPTRHPHLFVLRVWLNELNDGTQEWRGEIEHAATHEKRHFRDWQVLLEFVRSSCEQAQRHTRREGEFLITNSKPYSE